MELKYQGVSFNGPISYGKNFTVHGDADIENLKITGRVSSYDLVPIEDEWYGNPGFLLNAQRDDNNNEFWNLEIDTIYVKQPESDYEVSNIPLFRYIQKSYSIIDFSQDDTITTIIFADNEGLEI